MTSIPDATLARQRSLDVAEAVARRLISTCDFPPQALLAIGVGRDEAGTGDVTGGVTGDRVSIFADPTLIARIEELRALMY